MDISLLVRRSMIFGISFVVGLLISLGIVYVVLSSDIETYSYTYFVLTWIPIAFIFVVWGDALLDTKIMVE